MLTSNSCLVCENKSELESLIPFQWNPNSLQEFSQFYQDNGYLFLKSFFDANHVFDLRNKYLEKLSEPIGKNYGKKGHPAANFVQTNEFVHFAESENLLWLSNSLLGGETRSLKRKILRTYEQGSKMASPAHRDIEYFPEGTDQILTAWVPLGDCPVDQGGILYLKDSHRRDWSCCDFESKKWISKDLRQLSLQVEQPWMYADFKAGDIILHSPYIVHATVDCQTQDLRVSTDIRFVKKQDTSDWRWDNFWQADDGY